jgi:tetratricopeptide (TPR) repeat protein
MEMGMTDFNQVCKWLNQFEDTHLSTRAQTMMDGIDAELGLPAWGSASGSINIDEEVSKYAAHLEKSSDPEEYPEGMVRLARFYYTQGGKSIEALDILKRANTVYRKLPRSDFRVAIIYWLTGYVYLQMFDTQTAHDLWKRVIDKFENVIRLAAVDGEYPPEFGEFCQEILDALWVEILQLPEQVYSWLEEENLPWITGYGGGNHMNTPTLQLKEILISRQLNNNFRGVYADLEKFQKVSKESVHSLKSKLIYGEADAMAVSGMLLFWMGNIVAARGKFKAAADIYLPNTHPDAVVNWLLGLMYLFPPNDKRKGIACCQRAIHGFKLIQFNADVKHDRAARDWYVEKIDLLQRTLRLIENHLFS